MAKLIQLGVLERVKSAPAPKRLRVVMLTSSIEDKDLSRRQRVRARSAQLIILDLMIPRMDGVELRKAQHG